MSEKVNIDGPLISAEQIQSRVAELAAEITSDYVDREGQLSIIVVLKGACFFAVDLMRQLKLPLQLDFLRASSYTGTTSTGEVRLHSDISLPIAGTDVLLIEDIVDTGLTAAWLVRHLESHGPRSVRLCSLLDKPSRRRLEVSVHYVGFVIPDRFVLGYGLDYNESYRNLPAVHTAATRGDD